MTFSNSYCSMNLNYLSGAMFSSFAPRFSYVNPYPFKFGTGSNFGFGFPGIYSYWGTGTSGYKNFGVGFGLSSYSPSYYKSSNPTIFKDYFNSPKTVSYSPTFGSLTTRRPAISRDVGTVEGDAMFDKALRFVLGEEGGYANVSGDSGGETNKGITKATYDAWLKKNGLPAKNVRNITNAEVRKIYYEEYWKPLGCDKLPSKVALFVFDTAVNMGPGKAKEYLRRYKNGENLDSLTTARENRYREIAAANPQKRKFLNGWMNRMSSLKSTMAVA